jgi:tetratricopeptide (TPR) repeat protein
MFGMALMIGCNPEEPHRATSPQNTPSAEEVAIDSLRADSLYNVANTFYQNALRNWDMDSTVACCKEFYQVLGLLEERFSVDNLPEIEQLTKPDRSMINLLQRTYKGQGTQYSISLLPEATSYFYRQALAINKKYSNSRKSFGSTLFLIAYGFDICDSFDSACYYYDSAIRCFENDSSELDFRMSVSRKGIIDYKLHHDAEPVIRDLKALLPHCSEVDNQDVELTIGWIYKEEKQFDSALVYLNRAYEKFEHSGLSDMTAKAQTIEYLHEVYEALGETEKMIECARLLAQYPHAKEAFAPVTSELTELFNNYIQEKQEADTLLQKRQTQRQNLLIGAVILLVLLALGLVLWSTHKRHKQTEADLREEHQQQREAFDQQRETFNQQLNEVQTALKQKTFEDLKKQAQLLYDKGGHPRQSILDAFNKAYPDVYEKLKTAYPDLTESERDLLVLNFLQFRIKEEAEILDLSENTVMKYRSDLNKKVGKSPVSDLLG